MAPVKLPRYVIFKGDNGFNLGHKVLLEGYDFLQFKTTDRNLTVSHEVSPAPGEYKDEDVVIIKSLDNGKYWRWDPKWDSNWIWADKSDTPKADEKECLFKVVRVDDKTAALQCLGNSRYLKRRSGQRQTDVDCLAASASDYSDVTTHLQVTSALSERRVFDVEYDTKKMTEPSKSPPGTLGSKTQTNNSDQTKDIELDVRYTVKSEYSWRTVTTFNTGLDLTVKAGIPDFTTKNSNDVVQSRVKNGEMYTAETLKTITHTVKGVAPGETVEVEITGSQAKATVPFKYKFVDTRVDGLDLDEDSSEDGVFEGVQVLDIKAVESRRPGKAPVKLPSYVIFQGDNRLNLRLKSQEGHEYLMFNATDRDLKGSQEVIPLSKDDDVVMIKSLGKRGNEKYWRREPSSDWIWADKSDTPEAGDKDCLFKVVRVNDKTAALQCLANERYLKRFTADGKESCLNARASDYTDDDTTLLRVTSALSVRKVSNVKYDMEKMTEPSKSPPKTLKKRTETNNTSQTKDIEVVVEFEVESEYSWRTVTTFDTGLDLTVKAGIPDFTTRNSNAVVQRRVQNGERKQTENKYKMSHIFKRVKPRETVRVEIKGSQATARVPFKYTCEDFLVDGLDLDEKEGEDGVFEGVQVLDIEAVETRDV